MNDDTPLLAAAPPGDALPRLERLHRNFILLRRALDDVVLEAREDGATWDEIARALGVSRQAANRRFKHLETRDQPTTEE